MQLTQIVLGVRSSAAIGLNFVLIVFPFCDLQNWTSLRLTSYSSDDQCPVIESRSPLIFSIALCGYVPYGLKVPPPADPDAGFEPESSGERGKVDVLINGGFLAEGDLDAEIFSDAPVLKRLLLSS